MKKIKLLLVLITFGACSFKSHAVVTTKEVVEMCNEDERVCTMFLVGIFEGAGAASLSLTEGSPNSLGYCYDNFAKDKHSTRQKMLFKLLEKFKLKVSTKEYNEILELPISMFYYDLLLPKIYPLNKDCPKE